MALLIAQVLPQTEVPLAWERGRASARGNARGDLEVRTYAYPLRRETPSRPKAQRSMAQAW